MKQINVMYKDGTVFKGDYFGKNDFAKLKIIFKNWLELNKILKKLGGRGLNVPDIMSEGLFCYLFDAVRTNNTAYSFDCISRINGAGIQIKSGSIEYDLTSFGPTSTWDEIYYVDFAPNGIVDGLVYIYKLDYDIKNIVLNVSKNETFQDQQKQGRRPRFSIKKTIIESENIKPIKIINMLE